VRAASVLLAVLFLALACGGDGDGDGVTVAPASSATVAGQTPAAPSPSVDAAAVRDEPVRFQTSDGVTVRGHLYSASGPLRKAVVLAHERPKDQTAWRQFARDLAAAGYHALTFDFRGYGETGGSVDIAKIDLDLEAAVRFVKSREYPLVYVIGASMGGTAALKVAARQDLAGVATLSAPASISGLEASADVVKVTESKLLVAARGDEGGAYVRAAEQLGAAAPAPKETVFYDGREHGTDLLSGSQGAAVRQRLLQFLGAP